MLKNEAKPNKISWSLDSPFLGSLQNLNTKIVRIKLYFFIRPSNRRGIVKTKLHTEGRWLPHNPWRQTDWLSSIWTQWEGVTGEDLQNSCRISQGQRGIFLKLEGRNLRSSVKKSWESFFMWEKKEKGGFKAIGQGRAIDRLYRRKGCLVKFW